MKSEGAVDFCSELFGRTFIPVCCSLAFAAFNAEERCDSMSNTRIDLKGNKYETFLLYPTPQGALIFFVFFVPHAGPCQKTLGLNFLEFE